MFTTLMQSIRGGARQSPRTPRKQSVSSAFADMDMKSARGSSGSESSPSEDGGDYDAPEFSTLQILDVLGTGKCGRVVLVQSSSDENENQETVTTSKYALKCLRVSNLSSRTVIARECEMLKLVKGHFLMADLVHVYSRPKTSQAFLLMAPVHGGDLFAQIQRVHDMDLQTAKFYLANVVAMLEHLQGLNVVHRDLKPENLLIDANTGYLKLVDFGLAKRLDAASHFKTYTTCGTPAYAAPELFTTRGHGFAVDWWALGILTHELLVGVAPFHGRKGHKSISDEEAPTRVFTELQLYSRSYPRVRFPGKIRTNPAAEAFTLQLLHPNPHKRLGNIKLIAEGKQPLVKAQAVKGHEMFDGFKWDEMMSGRMVAPYVPGGSDHHTSSSLLLSSELRHELEGLGKVKNGLVWE